MDSRLNKLLIGVIILLIGVSSFFGRYLGIDYSILSLIFSGMGFLLLYKTKAKTWSLALGCYISYIGILKALSYFGLSAFAPHGASAMFFIIPGIIFLVLYHDKNKRSLLLPGMIFLWIGIYILIYNTGITRLVPIGGSNLLFFCVGAGFLCASGAGRDFMPKYVYILGISCVVLGVFLLFPIGELLAPLILVLSIPWLPSCILIAAALMFIIRQILRK